MTSHHKYTRLTTAAIILLATISFARENPQPGQGFIDVRGGPVWYEVSGTGDGLPLLVLHGGPGGTSCGFARLADLGSERPVIRYDQLGTGRSGRPDDLTLWTVERYIEELHELRNRLGLERLHLLGHSWGGALAAAYVLEKGTDGIVSLTLSSPLLSTPDWIADANYLRKQLPQDVQDTLSEHEEAGSIDSEEYQEASQVFYARHVYGKNGLPPPGACNGSPGSSIIYEYMWGPTEFYAPGTLQNFDVTDRLNEIDVPVLFMAGEFDEARPQRMREYQRLVENSKLHIVEGGAHITLHQEPEEYRRVIESFMDAVEANP